MATQSSTKAKASTTLDDVLGAVKGVGQRVDKLTGKVDAIDKRVTVLEAQPQLKTRIVQQQGNGHGQAVQAAPVVAPAPQVVYVPARPQDEGEDEAIQAGIWEKVIKTSRCYKIGVTKTRNRDSWKLKLYMRGQRRPATLIGWDGTAELVEYMKEVWPEVSDETFDEGTFAAQDKGKDIPVEFQYDGVHFLVDWFRTAPNWRGHTFINVEGVYPLAD
jgi:hypothetical protein